MKFKVFYALGGSFGGIEYCDPEICEFKDEDAAVQYAYEKAIEEYQSYEGMHGLRDMQQIMDEDGLDEDDAEIAYMEEMESWLDYAVEPIEGHKE